MGFLSVVANGLSMGAIYGLIALGLTLIFGIMRIINFAQGALLMLSMMTSYWIWKLTGLNPVLLIFLVGPIMFCVGYLCQRFLVKPVLDSEKKCPRTGERITLTAALAIVLENLALMMTFGADYVMAKTSFSDQTLALGAVTVSAARFYGLIIALVVAGVFLVIPAKNRIGRKIRATGQDRNAAALMGINVPKTFAIAFGLGTALLAVAAVALIPFYYVHPSVGQVFMTTAFIVVVLGGLGSVPGPFWAAS